MICPKCGVQDQYRVISTRKRNNDYVLRRRECVCGFRYNTVEIMELTEKNLKVIEREMVRNSKPRAFEKIIHDMYRQIFDRYRWLQDKRAEREAG